MRDLFATDLFEAAPQDISLGPGAMWLAGFARGETESLLQDVAEIARAAPFRHLVTPGGWTMSVAMTNCGALGWVSDRSGYRYDPRDPGSGHSWPAMPSSFLDLAQRAAARAGFADFAPDACLINRYVPGARLTLHQDRNERGLAAPIVSVSLGLPATFLWGGLTRADKTRRLRLVHGDVVVWGGPARMTFHGVDTLRDGDHPMTGAIRYNLTFRQAG
ncbi:MAG: alpha-ketoglutarate-dependent dioxygenase AlkB [Rhizobiales bacterium 62-17]|nr:DNA oxidative demethylase AlkB [Hyphomicrobiales bacterium]OJY04033.1 MAG: alpha-ketoglutarate-dependent dioxygenase AlkB [Rhizobiales bacterium 62-17]